MTFSVPSSSRTFRAAAAALTLLAAASAAQAALSYGSNLIVNGNAEGGASGWTAFAGTPLFSPVAYGSNWVLPTQPGPVDRGNSLFVGGSGVSYAAGFQQLDLGADAAEFAAGQVGFSLSGWLGGWSNQGDNAQLYVSFLDATGNVLATADIGPLTAAERNNTTGLFFVQTSGFVPAGTQRLQFDLSMERLASSDNDGYADNLAFTLSAAPVPEPGAWLLMALGLGLVGVAKRRRS